MELVKTPEIGIAPGSVSGLVYIPAQDDFVICKNPAKLKLLLDAISKEKTVHYISDGDWSTHDLVMELLKEYPPADLYITTYAIRETPMRQLILAQDKGLISSITMVLDYRAKARTPEVYHLTVQNMNRVALASIHAKVTVIESPQQCITISGSANWTNNPRIEQGMVSFNKDLGEFHINWIKQAANGTDIFN